MALNRIRLKIYRQSFEYPERDFVALNVCDIFLRPGIVYVLNGDIKEQSR